MKNTPVAFLVFNRPEHTARTFAAIRAARPEKLLIVADGPRVERPEEAALCAEVRRIVSRVDWPCEVLFELAETNLGCKRRISSGLDWVFTHVERAIILEDDCLPHADFFRFCETMLDRYEGDDRVMAITGDNFQDGRTRGEASYYFSKYVHVWGWATWRRAWRLNDVAIRFWPSWRSSAGWANAAGQPDERVYWEEIFDRVYNDRIDTWDYPWLASVWFHGGLTITPNVNLVQNIGVGVEATHTHRVKGNQIPVATALGSRLTHPQTVVRDEEADRYVFEHAIQDRARTVVGRLVSRGKRLVYATLRRMRVVSGRVAAHA